MKTPGMQTPSPRVLLLWRRWMWWASEASENGSKPRNPWRNLKPGRGLRWSEDLSASWCLVDGESIRKLWVPRTGEIQETWEFRWPLDHHPPLDTFQISWFFVAPKPWTINWMCRNPMSRDSGSVQSSDLRRERGEWTSTCLRGLQTEQVEG